ncbi:MAG: glycosyltransferase [Nitrospirae bacterium]|nr:glycosyltransferase [Nitrospirota bacterium]
MNVTIAQIVSSLHLAGQERVVVDLAKAFKVRGHRSMVCSTDVGGELVGELESSDIPCSCLRASSVYDPRSFIKVVRYLKDNRGDVVITHGNYRVIARTAAILLKIPIILHVEHNVSDFKRAYHILLNRAFALFTDKIVCISEEARRSLLDIEKHQPDKVVVIRNGLNTERFTAGSNVLRDRRNMKKRVAIVGRFTEQKGHIYFVEAISQIIRSYQDVEFVFVGDGPLRSMIEAKVDERYLRDFCHFLGVRSDMDQLFPSFDMFVLSSLWEGLPISLLEAQYFGVASVVTDVGGNAEVVQNDYNGLLVPPRDAGALATAILRVLNDDLLREKYSSNGRKVIEQRFSIDQMTTSYLDLIDQISEDSGIVEEVTRRARDS